MTSRLGGRSARAASLACAVSAALLVAPGVAWAADDTYIVQLTDEPLASYTGGTKGIPGTSPQVTGRKLKLDSANGLDYRSHLAGRQRAVLERVPGAEPEVVRSYRVAFAGFAARMTEEQARRLKSDPGVARVWENELLQPQQAPGDADARLGGVRGEGASYLRLTDPNVGLWNRLGGPVARNGAGSGVIVGIIDSGIQPNHPSFAANGSGYIGEPYDPPAVWDGACQAGNGFATSDCNNKLIGARYYAQGQNRNTLNPKSFLSPRDDSGHGTHTASTAAGNYGVDPSIDGNDLGIDIISGISPRSHVAVYKICWEWTPSAGCYNVDAIAAIDDAVADGVDVLNFSIGSATSTVLPSHALAFLGATDAGVFVANSGGNNGPGASTVGSPGSVPWLATVAASTLGRSLLTTVTVTGATGSYTVKGASVGNGLPDTPLVDAATAAAAGSTVAAAEVCTAGALDPTKVSGKVVLCLNTVTARLAKSQAVQQAGGVGMVLYNTNETTNIATDTHWVPTAHVRGADGRRIKQTIAAGPASAALTQGRVDRTTQERMMASFSSRGPQTAVPDLVKPDMAAPGAQILAGAADRPAAITSKPGNLFQSIQGTSMASPHVAGAGALLTQAHPTLSPAELKSELMLTANPGVLKEDGVTPATPFDRGAGEIDPNKAVDSGLILDTTTDEFLSYLEGIDPTLVDGTRPTIRPSDLNLPSIGFSRLAGADQTTRVFRSVGPTSTRWTVSVEAPAGITVTVPSGPFFTIRAGQTQAVTVRVARTTAALDQWAFGALVLTSNDNRTLRVPLVVRPIQISVPAKVIAATDAAAGSATFTVQPGFTGPFAALGHGLAAPTTYAGRRITATTGALNPSGNDPGTQLYPFTVPSGAQLISGRFGTVDNGAANTDLDLFLLRDPNGDGNFTDAVTVATSAGPDSAESITILAQTPANYAWAVVGYNTQPGGTVYDFHTWLVNDPSPDDPSNPPGLTVTGDGSATTGVPVTLSMIWSGVNARGTYLGLISYHATNAPAYPTNSIAYSVAELNKTTDSTGTVSTSVTTTVSGTVADPQALPQPVGVPTPVPDAGPSLGLPPNLGALPSALPVIAAPEVTISGASVRGRTLTLRVNAGQATSLRASVLRGKRSVARTATRKVGANASTVRLRLDRRLARGTYTVKVVSRLGTAQKVTRVSLKL